MTQHPCIVIPTRNNYTRIILFNPTGLLFLSEDSMTEVPSSSA